VLIMPRKDKEVLDSGKTQIFSPTISRFNNYYFVECIREVVVHGKASSNESANCEHTEPIFDWIASCKETGWVREGRISYLVLNTRSYLRESGC
jgi:hypothetical protein